MKHQPLLPEDRNTLASYGLDPLSLGEFPLHVYDKGEYLCVSGQPIREVLILVRGRAKIMHHAENGKRLLYCFYDGEGMLGDVEFACRSQVTLEHVQAITEVHCIAVPLHEGSLEALHRNAAFLDRMNRELASKLERSSRNASNNLLHPLDMRLCSYILGTRRDNLWKENLTDVAELLGTSYRHLLRTLDQLCLDGLLQKNGRSYLVQDLPQLVERSQEYYAALRWD